MAHLRSIVDKSSDLPHLLIRAAKLPRLEVQDLQTSLEPEFHRSTPISNNHFTSKQPLEGYPFPSVNSYLLCRFNYKKEYTQTNLVKEYNRTVKKPNLAMGALLSIPLLAVPSMGTVRRSCAYTLWPSLTVISRCCRVLEAAAELLPVLHSAVRWVESVKAGEFTKMIHPIVGAEVSWEC
jgi:hypothetical protein